MVRDTGGSDQPEVFFHSIEQSTLPGLLAGAGRTVVARTSGDASALVRELQRELLAIDPSLPVFWATTMALGARSSDVVGDVARDASVVLGAGAASGWDWPSW